MLDPSQLHKGLCFSDMGQFRKALKSYHIIIGRDYKYLRNESRQVNVCYDVEHCPFYMRASVVGKEFIVMIRKVIEPHQCGTTNDSSRINSQWLAEVFENDIRSDPDWKVTALIDQVKRKYGVEISKQMAYRARKIAAEKVLGNHKEQYKRIRDYCQSVTDKNPGSHVIVATTDRTSQGLIPRFFGLFMCLNVQIQGFLNGCRPFIGVDGCFVKLTNGAQVLAATARDGNNNLFPLAFGVVGVEDYKNWKWFLQMLHMAIGDGMEHGGWTIMSDRQKGLKKAVKDVFPDAEVRYCKWHIYQNFCTAGFRGGHLKEHFDAACYAYTKHDFNIAMEKLKITNEKAFEWLNKIPPKHWSRHAFRIDSKTDLVVNNVSEVFNNYIIDYRDKPIQTMMECIRTRLMTRTHNKREGAIDANWEITSIWAEKLELEKNSARYCISHQAGLALWQVTCNDKTYTVDLEKRTCECFKWDLSGLPCKHAVDAIWKSKLRPEDFVHQWLKKNKYMATYQQIIYPVPGRHAWVATQTEDIAPPKFTRQPGRPKKARRKSKDEPTIISGHARLETVSCNNCKLQGHNYRGCGKKLRPDLQVRKQNHVQLGDGGGVSTESLHHGTSTTTRHVGAMPTHDEASHSGTSATMEHGGATPTRASQTTAPATGYTRGRGRGRAAGAGRGRAPGVRRGSSSRLRRLVFGAE